MTKRKEPLPQYGPQIRLPGCAQVILFVILVEGGIALFIWLLTLMF